MKVKHKLLIAITALIGLTLACSAVNNPFSFFTNTENKPSKPPELPPPILDGAFAPGEASADEPVVVTGTIPFTSPFFLDMSAEPFVLLEDQAGFVDRNKDFVFALPGQAMGPVWMIDDKRIILHLSNPERSGSSTG